MLAVKKMLFVKIFFFWGGGAKNKFSGAAPPGPLGYVHANDYARWI